MKTHKDKVISFIDELISNYYEYDRSREEFVIPPNAIKDHDIDEFAALMLEDNDYAGEATGPDNDYFRISMIPTLIKWLQSPCDNDKRIDFADAYRIAMRKYAELGFWVLIEARLIQFNTEQMKLDED